MSNNVKFPARKRPSTSIFYVRLVKRSNINETRKIFPSSLKRSLNRQIHTLLSPLLYMCMNSHVSKPALYLLPDFSADLRMQKKDEYVFQTLTTTAILALCFV